MRLRRAIGLTAAGLTTVLGLPIPAAVADASTLYVNNYPAAHCSDTAVGAGTQAQPFCTIQVAAGAAQPGQTVQVSANGTWTDQVTITHSGTPGHPITISGSPSMLQMGLDFAEIKTDQNPAHPAHGFAVSGAHDVVIRGFDLYASSLDPIAVTDSSNIRIDENYLESANLPAQASYGIGVSGQSSDVTVSRNYLTGSAGIVVGAGAQRTILAGNDLSDAHTHPVTVTDAPGTVITNNTVSVACGAAISVAGSQGAVIENNIVSDTATTGCPAGGQNVPIAVTSSAVTQSRTDYNIVHPSTGGSAYLWNGVGYPTAAALSSATGQAVHDIDGDVKFSPSSLPFHVPVEGSPAIDSADPNAPGILDTDLLGNGPADDPKVPNTGPGGTFRDRGAYEVQGLTAISLIVNGATTQTPTGPAPLSVTAQARSFTTWNTTQSYSFDFGDGSAPVVSSQPQATHVYPTIGSYHVTVTATDGRGGRIVSQDLSHAQVTDPALTLTPVMNITRIAVPALTYDISTTGSSSGYALSKVVIDYGDGSAPQTTDFHSYQRPGRYTIATTVTDESGASKTVSQQVDAEYDPAGFVPVTPYRVLDTRLTDPSLHYADPLGSWAPRSIYLNVPSGATAVVLNVTATRASGVGHLTLYPDGGAAPTTSNLNYTPGRDIANVVTVPMGPYGTVTVATNTGYVDVVVDVLGYYKPGATDKFTPLTPSRLLDTRSGGDAGKLGPQSTLALQVRGSGGVPASATAVVLNLTATEATDSSFLAAYPSDKAFTGTSNLNFQPGRNTPNQVIVPIGPDGKVTVYNHGGRVHVIADVFGYYSPDGKGLFTPVWPTRLLDTRNQPNARPGPGSVTVFGGLPANATAASLNLTSTRADNDGFLTVFADGTARPGTSNLNLVPATDLANHAITPVGNGGRVDIYNLTGHTDIVADMFGYFTES